MKKAHEESYKNVEDLLKKMDNVKNAVTTSHQKQIDHLGQRSDILECKLGKQRAIEDKNTQINEKQLEHDRTFPLPWRDIREKCRNTIELLNTQRKDLLQQMDTECVPRASITQEAEEPLISNPFTS